MNTYTFKRFLLSFVLLCNVSIFAFANESMSHQNSELSRASSATFSNVNFTGTFTAASVDTTTPLVINGDVTVNNETINCDLDIKGSLLIEGNTCQNPSKAIASTNSRNGALVCLGGAGVGLDLHVGGAIDTNTEYRSGNCRILKSGTSGLTVGLSALDVTVAGSANTAVGNSALSANNGGIQNTAVGAAALQLNQIGTNNTAVGTSALNNNLANGNSAMGAFSLYHNTAGANNTTLGSGALFTNSVGSSNTAVGANALASSTVDNLTAVGFGALAANTSGTQNTGLGTQTLQKNTIGYNNTAVGFDALPVNTVGNQNTAVGAQALLNNVGGSYNVAVGPLALFNLVSGTSNTAVGNGAGQNYTGAESGNILLGSDGVVGDSLTLRLGQSQQRAFIAGVNGVTVPSSVPVFIDSHGQLATGTTGTIPFAGPVAIANTAPSTSCVTGALTVAGGEGIAGNLNVCGYVNASSITAVSDPLLKNYKLQGFTVLDATGAGNLTVGLFSGAVANGTNNTVVGNSTLAANVSGNQNTALGVYSLAKNTSGSYNVALGAVSLFNLISGISNTVIGNGAGQNYTGAESGNILLGSDGVVGDSSTMRLGQGQKRTFIAGISGNGPFTNSVMINPATGQLGDVTSSRRFKKNIRPLAEQTQNIMNLQPVSFAYKNDAEENEQYGLIAEEVVSVYPNLVSRDAQGEIYSVNYMALIPLLLAQVQQLQKQVDALQVLK